MPLRKRTIVWNVVEERKRTLRSVLFSIRY